MSDEKKGGMTVAEAGRKGGNKVKAERGTEFYKRIGKLGGDAVMRERGHAFFEEIGKKGGNTVKAERGPAFFEEIGRKGGEMIKAERGTPFYAEIGRKGGAKVKGLIAAGKVAEAKRIEAKATALPQRDEILPSITTVDDQPAHKSHPASLRRSDRAPFDRCKSCDVQRSQHHLSRRACRTFVEPRS